MMRDMDLIRKIMLAARETEGVVNGIDGVDKEMFAAHVQLLDEAGLLVAAINGTSKRLPVAAIVYRLTWSGHDFADSIIDNTLWNKAKENVIKPASSWTFGILLEYLKAEIRSNIPGL